MDLMTAILGGVILGLIYTLWVWWRAGKTWQPFCAKLRRFFRATIGAANQDDMKTIQEHFQRREGQWESRMTKVEAATKFSSQLQYVSKEIDQRVRQLEHSAEFNVSSRSPRTIPKPRSLVRLGVRVTLSDGIWAHIGTELVDEIDDHRLDAMIQGPFCPECLRRVVGRDRSQKMTKIPPQCRFCGISWECQGIMTYPLLLIDLKREVYRQLDEEYRNRGKMLKEGTNPSRSSNSL